MRHTHKQFETQYASIFGDVSVVQYYKYMFDNLDENDCIRAIPTASGRERGVRI
jgi:hypothetical protein